MYEHQTLLIDSHYIGHQAHYSHKGLKSEDGTPTDVLFGFLSRVLFFCTMFKTNDVVFCWDSSKSIRKLEYPWYKDRTPLNAKEKADRDKMRLQFKVLRTEILPAIGFKNNLIKTGYEADDLLASIVQSCIGNFVIIAGDQDLYQLLYNSRIYHPQSKKMMTGKRLLEERECHAAEWAMVKQIAGCTSDAIPGIKGVAEKTAIKYLRNKLPVESKAYKAIKSKEGQAIIDRNRWLVRLPLPGLNTPSFTSNHFDMKAFKKICRRYSFDSFLDEVGLLGWEDLFSGNFEIKDDDFSQDKRRNFHAKP